jgi:hypothetical protein
MCPVNAEKVTESNCIEAFAVKHKDTDIIANSSSGGIFTALSDKILENEGKLENGEQLPPEIRNMLDAYFKALK